MSAAPRLFHLVPQSAWRTHRASGAASWAPPSLGAEGFVHLSTAEQLAGTLEVHFAAFDAVVLLEVEARSVAADLRFEASRGGELFPHLYRALRDTDFLGSWVVSRTAGHWAPPRLGAESAADAPPATPYSKGSP